MNYYVVLLGFGLLLLVLMLLLALYFCNDIIGVACAVLAAVIVFVGAKLYCDIKLHSKEPYYERDTIAYECKGVYDVYEENGSVHYTVTSTGEHRVIQCNENVCIEAEEPSMLYKYYVNAYCGTPAFYNDKYVVYDQFVFR